MVLGPHHSLWRQLYEALASLAASCGGTFAFVLDEGNGLWCVGIAGKPPTVCTEPEDRAADVFYEREIVPRQAAMRRGARLHAVQNEADARYFGVSFAGIYALVVWFDATFDVFAVTAHVRRALPEIERLTLALPLRRSRRRRGRGQDAPARVDRVGISTFRRRPQCAAQGQQ